MRVIKTKHRTTQLSLLNEEQHEAIVLFEVEHNGQTGTVLVEASVWKRDYESTLFCDIPDVTIDDLINAEIDVHAMSEKMDEPLTDEIKAEVARLQDYEI